MQSMLKNGTPGEAAVLAKSSDGKDLPTNFEIH